MRGFRRLLAALAGLAALGAAAVWLLDGIGFRAAGLRITASDPVRPATAGAALALLYLVAARRGGLSEDVHWAARVPTPARLALAIALAATVVSFAFNSQTAGGSDSYGYVTHADAWRSGTLHRPVEPLAASAPWPRALDTFTPFAQHPSPDRQTIVPVTSPGLPLLMAAFGAVAGHCAQFWVIPLTGALFIWSTFLIGRRVASPAAGVAAA